MPLLALSHVTMHHGGPVLLDDVTLGIEPGARIGVIGRNGVGKTTLLRLLALEAEPVSGEVVRQRGVRVSTQTQELKTPPGVTLLDEMRRVFAVQEDRERRLRAIEERLGAHPPDDERRRLLADYERLLSEHEATRGFDVELRIGTVLSRLGLPESVWSRTLDTFSGGERNVIGLARVILSEPDVMLLDEPSNHLDMEGVDWFAQFVRESKAAVVMVSHNRHLLDETVATIWEVHAGKVTAWTGNYTEFQKQKAEARALQERQWVVQRRLIERIEHQARRLKDMANAYDDPGQARRARSMEKRLERMEKVDRPEAEGRSFGASLSGAPRHGRIALQVRGFSAAYGDRVLFEDASLEIEQGERVCLVGPNGSGKTTLFRRILEEGSWENPVLRLGKSVRVGEYRQLHDALDPATSLVDWLSAETGLITRDSGELLHRFLFSREDLDRPIGTLSGGEKSRLQLARLVHGKVNLLLLDEPTNHLDIQACEQLEAVLAEFDGTLLVISHDRYFLDKLVDRVVEVADRKLVSHRLSFPEWWEWRRATAESRRRGALERRDGRPDAAADAESARREREERKEREREARRTRNRMAALEERIRALETRQTEISRRLEAVYGPDASRDDARPLEAEFARTREEIDRLYDEWASLEGGGSPS
jgi:ATP-binding cassette subfamily F protein 3